MSEIDEREFGDDVDELKRQLATVKEDGEIIEAPTNGQVTPAQAKANAIASVTMSAYARASELVLTKEENDALNADFPDDAFKAGAGGDNRLIYIEHAFLRDRFNEVIGRGQWALVTRSNWTEEFTYYKDGVKLDGVRVYAEVMLMVRGCFISESVGEMTYYPANPKTTYADAITGSRTAAFRRCARDFGVGMQAWKKDWCAGWWERAAKNGGKRPAAQAKVDEGAYLAGLVKRAEAEAVKGIAVFQAFWEKVLTKNERQWLKDDVQRLKASALAVGKGDAYEGDQNL